MKNKIYYSLLTLSIVAGTVIAINGLLFLGVGFAFIWNK